MVDFKDTSANLGLSYAKRWGNHIHWTFYIFLLLFLENFFLFCAQPNQIGIIFKYVYSLNKTLIGTTNLDHEVMAMKGVPHYPNLQNWILIIRCCLFSFSGHPFLWEWEPYPLAENIVSIFKTLPKGLPCHKISQSKNISSYFLF